MPNALIRAAAVWNNGTTVTPQEFSTLETNLVNAINGDAGGEYAPTGQIVISGGFGLNVAGGALVTRGGKLTLTGGGNIAFALGDFPQFAAGHTGRTRPVSFPCALAMGYPRAAWRARPDAGMQSVAPVIDYSDGLGPRPSHAFLAYTLRAHQGATIGAITVNFRVGAAHAAVPTTMPSARILRIDATGNAVALTSVAAGGDANGYVYAAAPATPSAWYNSGAKQSLVVPCDQNNVVDVTQYTYLVEFVDEVGPTGYPFTLVFKPPVDVASTVNVNLASIPGTIDGVTLTAGMRVLLKNQTDPTQNGIYTSTGVFLQQRVPDLQFASDFSQGMAVLVLSGETQQGTIWQVQPSITSWAPGTLVSGLKTWASGTVFALGTYAVPTPTHVSGYYYQVTANAGTSTSGGAEPAWPTTPGQTVIDNPGGNQITWTCMGPVPSKLLWATKSLAGVEGSSFLAHGTIFQNVVVEFDNITSGRFQ